MAGDGPLQLSLFDEQDLAEITSPDFPGERLIACRNPFEAAKRARTRGELLAATEADLEKIAARAAAGRVKDPDKIGVAAGKVINKRKVAKHFILDIGPKGGSPGAATRHPSTPRPPPTGSTSSAPPSPQTSLTRPAPWPPTRTSPASNGTSATSRPRTWTCGPSGTGWRTASAPTC